LNIFITLKRFTSLKAIYLEFIRGYKDSPSMEKKFSQVVRYTMNLSSTGTIYTVPLFIYNKAIHM